MKGNDSNWNNALIDLRQQDSTERIMVKQESTSTSTSNTTLSSFDDSSSAASVSSSSILTKRNSLTSSVASEQDEEHEETENAWASSTEDQEQPTDPASSFLIATIFERDAIELQRVAPMDRGVRFDLRCNKFYEHGRRTTADELRSCWYMDDELKSFKRKQVEVVKALFARPQDFLEQEQPLSISSPKQRRLGKAKTIMKALMRHPSKRKSLEPEQQPQTLILPPPPEKEEVASPSSQESFDLDEDEQPHWRDLMAMAYRECRKVEGSKLLGQVDRDMVAKLYKDYDELVGLETYVLFAMRGSVSAQVDRILEYVKECEKGKVLLLRQRQKQREREARAKLNEAEKEILEMDVEMEMQHLLLKTCRRLTFPASIFAHEIALAQATANKE